MPYFITVLALVVLSVGFTLFQSQDEVAEGVTETQSLEKMEEKINALIATNTPAIITDIVEDVSSDDETSTQPETPSQPTTPATNNPTPSAPTPAPAAPTPAPAITTDYRNGTYSAQSSYRTPDGTYQISVNLTVANDKITGSTISFDSRGARDGYSKRFSSSYQSAIIGQDLGSASLSRVGGASLTTRAFNTALDSIRSQATS
jgi:hypothetical protein